MNAYDGAGSKLHEDKIARGDKIARRDKIARGQNCTKGQICTKTFLHEDKFSRGDKFARGDKIARRQICTKGQFCTSDKFARRVKFARLSNLHGLGLKKKKLGLGLKKNFRAKFSLVQKWPSVQKCLRAKLSSRAKVSSCKFDPRANLAAVQICLRAILSTRVILYARAILTQTQKIELFGFKSNCFV